MKIITRYDTETEDGYTYCVYLLDDNNRPIKVEHALSYTQKNVICEHFILNYPIKSVEDIKMFNIDLSSTPEYNKQ